MAKAFSVASWNVEHFKDDPARLARIVDLLVAQDPDVLAIYEVEGKDVYRQMVTKLPGYTFHITEGPQTQEILLGVRSRFTAFFTQRVEFKSRNPSLRPGALLTLHIGDHDYSVLFLHTKSLPSPVGLGLRDDMFTSAFKLKKALDRAALPGRRAHFIFLGDLNTMGMDYFPKALSILAAAELAKLDRDAAKAGMRRLSKAHDATWWNGPASRIRPSDLDHVVASDHLIFKPFGGADVDVRGWPKESTDVQKGAWIKRFSDHAILYFEVQKI
jgi:hypothetical protein